MLKNSLFVLGGAVVTVVIAVFVPTSFNPITMIKNLLK